MNKKLICQCMIFAIIISFMPILETQAIAEDEIFNIIEPLYDQLTLIETSFEDYELNYIMAMKDGKYDVIDSYGNNVTNEKFDRVNIDFESYYVYVYKNEKKGAFLRNGNLIKPIYDDVYVTKDVILVISDEKVSLLDIDGNTILNTDYKYGFALSDNIFAVSTEPKNKRGKWGVIDSTGKVILDIIYDDIEKTIFNLDVYRIVLRSLDDKIYDKYGLINDKGEIMCEPIYNWIDKAYFDKEIFTVVIADRERIFGEYHPSGPPGKKGILSFEGEVILNPKYDKIIYGNGDYYIVEENGLWNIIDKNDKFIAQLENGFEPNHRGHFVIKDEKYYKLNFLTGKAIKESEFDGFGRFANDWGFAYLHCEVIKKNGLCGLYNYRTGEIVLEPLYKDIYISGDQLSGDIIDEFLLEDINGKVGLCDDNGRIVISNNYDNIITVSDSIYAVVANNKIGFIDNNEKVLTDFIYDSGKKYTEGLAPVMRNEKWTFIDINGNEVIPPQFEELEYFVSGIAPFLENGKFGYVDKNGNIIVPAIYDEYTNGFIDDMAPVIKDGVLCVINKQGDIVKNTELAIDTISTYTRVSPPPIRTKVFNGVYSIEKDEKYGLFIYKSNQYEQKEYIEMIPLYGDVEEYPKKDDIPPDKMWTVEFNHEVDEQTLDSVYISFDKHGTKKIKDIKTLVINEKDKNAVEVYLENKLPKGTYYLIVRRELKNNKGNNLNKNVIMQFEIL